MSGRIVERRDQVFRTRFSPAAFIAVVFSRSGVSTNGPFFVERDIVFPRIPYLRRLTIKLSVRLLLRVFLPFVFQPHGEVGWRPPEVLPSPWGWKTKGKKTRNNKRTDS